MRYWLMKSEPNVFSIDDLKQQKVAGWDGVRNYQARNFLREMKKGDLAFFYHSSTSHPAVAGIVEIVREAYPDPTQFDRHHDSFDSGSTHDRPRWDQVDVRFVERFDTPLLLDDIRRIPALATMLLLRHSRLSVQPVTADEWRTLVQRVG
jgi:predicted RNA-binding protein with PUA-like domain